MLINIKLLIGCGSISRVLYSRESYALELTLFLVSKLAIGCSFQILYFFAFEIFPTNMRNSLLSFCSMVGRFGSMLAPQSPLLAKSYEYAPQIVFTLAAFISGFLILSLPETSDKVLPTTMEEAENLSEKKNTKRTDTTTGKTS